MSRDLKPLRPPAFKTIATILTWKSQHSPVYFLYQISAIYLYCDIAIVVDTGFEPVVSCVSSRCFGRAKLIDLKVAVIKQIPVRARLRRRVMTVRHLLRDSTVSEETSRTSYRYIDKQPVISFFIPPKGHIERPTSLLIYQ